MYGNTNIVEPVHWTNCGATKEFYSHARSHESCAVAATTMREIRRLSIFEEVGEITASAPDRSENEFGLNGFCCHQILEGDFCGAERRAALSLTDVVDSVFQRTEDHSAISTPSESDNL